MSKILLFICLISCTKVYPTVTVAPISVEDEARRHGYFLATFCLGNSGIPYDSIKVEYVPGKAFTIDSNTFIGYTLKNKILISEEHKDEPRLYAHEYAHYLSGVMDHPDSIFVRCNF